MSTKAGAQAYTLQTTDLVVISHLQTFVSNILLESTAHVIDHARLKNMDSKLPTQMWKVRAKVHEAERLIAELSNVVTVYEVK